MARYATDLTVTLEQKLADISSEVVCIEGDGHCLLNALRTVLVQDPSIDVGPHLSISDIIGKLREEIHDNYDFYESFLVVKEGSDKRSTFRDDIDRLVSKGIYDNDSSDIALPALCNAFNITIIILQPRGDSLLEIRHSPNRKESEKMCMVHLLRTPTEPEHYDAILQVQRSKGIQTQSLSFPRSVAARKRKHVQSTIDHMFEALGKKSNEKTPTGPPASTSTDPPRPSASTDPPQASTIPPASTDSTRASTIPPASIDPPRTGSPVSADPPGASTGLLIFNYATRSIFLSIYCKQCSLLSPTILSPTILLYLK
jgi:OTU-like cysteine protease